MEDTCRTNEFIGYKSCPLDNSHGIFQFGYVGYLDILGFKNKVKDKTKRKLLVENYNEIFNYVKNDISVPIEINKLHGFGEDVGKPYYNIICLDKNKHVQMISDSIFVVILPERKEALYMVHYAIAIFIVMSKIQSICITNNLPARGSISSGEMYYDSLKGIFIGEPIVQAALWEGVQNFS
jgi:hypothetical protein